MRGGWVGGAVKQCLCMLNAVYDVAAALYSVLGNNACACGVLCIDVATALYLGLLSMPILRLIPAVLQLLTRLDWTLLYRRATSPSTVFLETMLVHVECCVLMLQLHCTWACCLCLFFGCSSTGLCCIGRLLHQVQ